MPWRQHLKLKHAGASKRKRGSSYATALDLPLSPAFQEYLPRALRGMPDVQIVCVRQLAREGYQPQSSDQQITQYIKEVWERPLPGQETHKQCSAYCR